MLDFDLAELYEVETRVMNQSVKRNITRFPEDFMFQLTWQELSNLKSQIVTSSWGGTRKRPLVFTEQGVAMLSAVLRSEKAILTSIAIMRAFIYLRRYALTFDEIATKVLEHDKEIADIHEALRQLAPDEKSADTWENRPRIGFKKPGSST